MRVVAIDPSLTSLGFAYKVGDRETVGRVQPKRITGMERLGYIRGYIEGLLEDCLPDLVVYEDYSMGSKGKTFHIGELGGVLKLAIYERKIPILLVPPSSLKLFATGKGNADKDQVKVAMAKVRGRLFESDDEADAYALLQLGIAYSDRRQMPRDRRHYKHTALSGCELVAASDG